MRFKQYLNKAANDFITDPEDVKEWLDKHAVNRDRLRNMSYLNISKNGEISVVAKSHEIWFGLRTILHGKNHLPVQFDEVTADKFRVLDMNITSLKGFPRYLIGDLAIDNCNNLLSLEGLPKEMNRLKISNSTLSLEGISNYLGVVHDKYFDMNQCTITSGGIGLILCPSISRISGHQPAFDIIQKYLGRPDDIFDCQIELIDAGFEEYAKL